MITLYGMGDSGNCYKPRLLLAKLGIAFRHVEVNSLDGSTRKPDFLAKNPNGKVPLLETEDGRHLAESNAMLLYLAEGTRFLPQDRFERALVYQWLFFEQYSHEPAVAVRRALLVYPERAHQRTPARLAETLEAGNKALGVMEDRLRAAHFFAGGALSVADIALYAYTHQAG
ncbi:MAG: glutathione S-transferase family protein, partial [Nitratireductor sp.]